MNMATIEHTVAGEQHNDELNAVVGIAASPATQSDGRDAQGLDERQLAVRYLPSEPQSPNAGEQHDQTLNARERVAASPAPQSDGEAHKDHDRLEIIRSPSEPSFLEHMNAREQHSNTLIAVGILAAPSATPSDGGNAQRYTERLSRFSVSPSDPSSTTTACAQLIELQVRRRFVIKAKNRQVNAAEALIRRVLGFDPNATEKEREAVRARAQRMALRAFAGKPQLPEDEEDFNEVATDIHVVALAIEPLVKRRKEIEKDMVLAARALPVAQFAKGVAGFGEIGLAVLVGETGDLSNYPNFRHVWKRLGLMPFDGKACSIWRRSGGMPAGGWERVGYSPQRRAEIHACVAESMSKHQLEAAAKTDTEFGKPKGKYGHVYVARREKMKLAQPAWPKAHAKMDAMRIMTKALVADLWLAWPR